DARQLYPHELARPLPPEQATPPPVYSLEVPPQADDAIPSPVTPSSPEHRFGFGRKASTQLGSRGSVPRLGREESTPGSGREGSEPPRLGRKGSEPGLARKRSDPKPGRKGSEPQLGRKGSEPRIGRKSSALFCLVNREPGKRGSGAFLGMFGRKGEGQDEDEAMRAAENGMAVEMDTRQTMEQAREMYLKLPPARKTKDLPIQSFGPDALPAADTYAVPHQDWGGLRAHWADEAQHMVTSTADITEYRFTEAEDFGIVVSEAYEEDEDCPYPHHHQVQTLSVEEGASGGEDSVPGSSAIDQPLAQMDAPTPVLESAPARTSARRAGLPDIFSFATSPPASPSPARKPKSSPALDWALSQARAAPSVGKQYDIRRGSRHDLELDDGEVVLMSPRWRTIFGPMTLIHDPLVRRAQWALTVRCWIVAGAMACGMAFGLIR
ncbi:hypothetical protein FRC06_005799, partial [Ceratobasidium sp. 370]